LVGPLPSCGDFNHLLTVVDRSSRWLEAIPISSTTAAAVADALVTGWIARFGVPAQLTSDRGVQFCSEVWASLMSRLGVQHNLTTAYHPQANGMVERSHRQLKDALRARLAGADWLAHLPWVLLSLRATPKEDSAVSSAELVYGRRLVLPGQLTASSPLQPPRVPAKPIPSSIPTRRLPTQPASANSGRLLEQLWKADFVYVRRGHAAPPLTPFYSGPFPVLSRSPKSFTLDFGDRTDVLSVDRLKPHVGSAPVVPASGPRRGRPPKSVP
jgi:hypothetical protein